MIRMGTIEDLERLDALARIVARGLHAEGIDQWSEKYPATVDFARDLAAKGLIVAEEDKTVVGSLSLLADVDEVYRILHWPSGPALVIHRLMVDPLWRSRKVGTALMEAAVQIAKKHGYAVLKVDTHPDNQRMQRFLKRFGFEEVGYLAPIHRIAFVRLLEE